MSELNPAPKPPRKPGLFNARQLRELDETDEVVRVSRLKANASKLLKRGITAEFADALEAKSTAARNLLIDSKAQKGASQDQTDATHQRFRPKSPIINTIYYGSMRLLMSVQHGKIIGL